MERNELDRAQIVLVVRRDGVPVPIILERTMLTYATYFVNIKTVVVLIEGGFMPAARTIKKACQISTSDIFPKIFNKELKTDMDVVEMSRQGVTKGSLISFGTCFGFTPDKLAYMLPVTLRTIQRYRSRQRFNPTISEHIIQLARLMVRGTEVFESRDNFLRWFTTPNTALGGKIPSELVSLQTGAQLVMDELIRIDHGVFA